VLPTSKVSVVIPAFNQAAYLRLALESVINQTYKNLEIIVIDDGSTDNTRQLVEEYAKNDLRIIYIYQENDRSFGLGSRNWGMLNATGDWIALLDQDDIWYPRKIEDQLSLSNQNPDAGCIFCPVDFIDENGLITGTQNVCDSLVYSYETFLADNKIYVSSGIFKRKLLAKAGLPNESSGYADWWLWLSLSKHTKIISTVNVLAAYRIQHLSYQQQQIKNDLHKFALDNVLTTLTQKSRTVISPSLNKIYNKSINRRAKLYLRASYKDLANLKFSKFLQAGKQSVFFTTGLFNKVAIVIRLIIEAPLKALIQRFKINNSKSDF
jgi:glycosyltransferase involved in cell wall biosynthesis